MNIEKYFSLRSKIKIFKKRVRKYTDYNLPFFLKKKIIHGRRQPPSIGSNGYFSWIKPILKVSDETLLEKIGCDALLYIRFVRLLRQLLFWMTVIGVCALIPIYIVATKYTGQVTLYLFDILHRSHLFE